METSATCRIRSIHIRAAWPPQTYTRVSTAPSASFLTDLNALKHDAATNNLSAAVTDLAKAKTDAPKYFAGAYEAGDENGVAAITVETADNVADYLQTQGATAVQAKADANAIILSSSVVLGIGASLTLAASNTTEESQITSQVTSLATAAAEQDSSTTNVTSDPLFNIVESLYKSAQVSDSSSLQTLSLLNSLYTGNSTSASRAATTASNQTTTADAVNSYA